MSLPTCQVRVVVFDSAGGAPVAGAQVQAQLSSYDVGDGYVVPRLVVGTTDIDGEAFLDLWPNQLGSSESFYTVTITAPNGKRLRTIAVVPNQASADLKDIAELPPYEGKPEAAVYLNTVVQAAQDVTQKAQQVHDDADATAQAAGVATQKAIDAGQFASNAEGAANAAAASDASAAEHEDGALEAKVAAEAARDSLNTTGKVFTAAELADGTAIANTTSGQQFSVLSADSLSYGIYRNNAGADLKVGSGSYTKEYQDRLGEASTPRYFRGKLVLVGDVDLSGVGGAFITQDGQHYANYALRGGNGVSVQRAADGFFELALGQVQQLVFGSLATDGVEPARYYKGKLVRWASTDSATRGAVIELDSGEVHIPGLASLVGGNGITVTPGPDGPVISVGTIPLVQATEVRLPAGSIESSAPRYVLGERVISGDADSLGRAGVVLLESGRAYIPRLYVGELTSPSLQGAGASAPLETADYVFDVRTVGAGQQVFRTGKRSGAPVQITSVGNNTAPRLSLDGSRVVYSGDRGGVRQGYYQALSGARLGGSVEHPVSPLAGISPSGDSMTAGGYADVVAAAFGVPMLAPSNAPEGGIGSQKTEQIAARFGAVALTCSLSGNAMAAGANLLTAISIQLLSRVGDIVGSVRSLPCWLAGVAGTLTATQSAAIGAGALAFAGQGYTYTFTPAAGEALPSSVPAGAPLEINPMTRQDGHVLMWVGRNDVGIAGWQDIVLGHLTSMIAVVRPIVKRIGLLSICNSVGEPAGSANHTAIVAFNATLAAQWPEHFIDVRTAYNAGTSDDTPNPAFTADGTHYTTAGRTAIAGAVVTTNTSRGWFQ